MNEQKTINDVTQRWKADKQQYVKRSSFSAYVLLVENHILPVFGSSQQIKEHEVQAFVFKKIAEGLSQKSIKDILIVLKMILKFGEKQKWIEYEHFNIQFPTQCEKANVDVLSRSHQKIIMDHVQEHFTFRNLGIYICLSGGMRIGEICALMWDDIDTDNGVIHVRRTLQRIYMIEQGCRKTELLLDTPKTKIPYARSR